MQYRIDPRSGARLSALGYGCMRFPLTALGRIDADKAEALVLDAVGKGVNYFDTAYLYRGSEEVLGAIIEKNGLRGSVHIATKLPHGSCTSFEDFDRFLGIQLDRLRTDRIDYYLVHNIMSFEQWERLVDLGIERWISEKKRSGVIERIGFSFHGSQDDFMRMLDAYDWDFCQIQYNYLNENYQAGRAGLEAAAERGLPVIVMEPLLGGKLAGGLPRDAVREFEKADPSASPAAWALAWVWDHPQVTVLLSGMNDLDQLAENVAVAERALPGSMSEADRAAVAAAVGIISESYRVPCTGCNYCMPCPKGINIPALFSVYNTSFVTGRFAGMYQYVVASGAMGDNSRLASDCISCGACVKKCPQRIDVPASLSEVRRRLQPFFLPPVLEVVKRVMR